MDARETNERLRQQIEDLCVHLLPGGKRHGREWLGGLPGHGDAFRVVLEGPKRGTWTDFNPANGTRGGSALDLWMLARSCDFKTALAEAKEWLRVPDAPAFHRPARPAASSAPVRLPERSDSKPRPPRRDWKDIEEGSPAWKYLVDERGIRPEVLAAYRIGEATVFFPEAEASLPAVVFPAYSADGETLLMVKYLALERRPKFKDGKAVVDANGQSVLKKFVRANKEPVYHLIGMHAVPADARDVSITEGEIDMLSLASEGIAAVSVPFGAKAPGADGVDRGNAWIEHDWKWLEGFEDVFLALDADEEGKVATAAIAPRIGLHRVRLVDWALAGAKDANEALQSDPRYVHEAIHAAAMVTPESLRRVRQMRDEIFETFFPSNKERCGVKPGFLPKDFPFDFRPAEVTLWTGYSGHGKTVNLTHCAVDFASQGHRVCIASLEIKPARTLRTVLRQAIGRSKPVLPDGRPDLALFERAIEWADDRFFIYDHVGTAYVDDVLAAFAYAAKRFGVTHFIVDSLMRLDVHEEDTERQKQVMNALVAFAQQYDVHVHLVAHAKKPDAVKRPETKYPPRKHDVLGSVHLTNLAHNVIIVWRHKAKEQVVQAVTEARNRGHTEAVVDGKRVPADAATLDKANRDYDALWKVEKQREGEGEEPMRLLWFDAGASWQYFDRPGADALVYMNVRPRSA